MVFLRSNLLHDYPPGIVHIGFHDNRHDKRLFEINDDCYQYFTVLFDIRHNICLISKTKSFIRLNFCFFIHIMLLLAIKNSIYK